MRLIDADVMRTRIKSNIDETLASVVREWVDRQETVNAVPMEWLEKKYLELKKKEYGDFPAACIAKVMQLWEKEQEVE